ncbi:PTS sugar transporter subunit IIA [Olsenella sp. HMSC062G07]|uniref:PTS sugar transporter subunit IIA n=1 Tax=Olsenella sp. HMSC062G07 TaxID=1739330 RepID=UPI0008A2AF16|nr:fructose PTS transporter subunit IIA [Olsenella sp. HMSC062G07]OFK23404.1 PTS fructose transporter subunit IIA [Olsenella sp. HMSC062G07]
MSDVVAASQVFLDNPATTVDEALEFISAKAVELGIATDAAATLAAFKAREAQGTTGMQAGFAIPHAKSDAIVKAAVLVVKFAHDVAWESMDRQPIRVAVALCIPEAEAGTTHLKILSNVALLLMDDAFCSTVKTFDDPAVIAAAVNEGVTQ